MNMPRKDRWPSAPAGGKGNARLSSGDAVVLVGLVGLLYLGVRLAVRVPEVITGPRIDLSAGALPWYALLSTLRMAAAYLLSLGFSLAYGYAAARSPRAEKSLLPILDVLQSVPILSFLPVVVLFFLAFLPDRLALELGAVVLIFTSQAWNLTFSFYQSLKTVPSDMTAAAATFRFSRWLRFRYVEVPFAAIGLIWNSMMSWAGGWFFLMASETFNVGRRDFRLPGLGSYLQAAANSSNTPAIIWGVFTLVAVIVALDQFLWRPLLAWGRRFKVETVEQEEAASSWFYDMLSRSLLLRRLQERVLEPAMAAVDEWLAGNGGNGAWSTPRWQRLGRGAAIALGAAGAVGAFYCGLRALFMLATLGPADWARVALGTLATMARVATALAIALFWAVPVGVALGTSPRLARIVQPLVQLLASIPATALFPIVLLLLLEVPGGLNIAAVLLMLMGTQWYVLFNVIAGANAIPQDLKYTAATLGVRGALRWRILTLPAIFPYLITGMITASGGSWNASIVAEYVNFGGQTRQSLGLGALISQSTDTANYPLLLAATVTMILVVVSFNRFLWRRLYRLAGERYRLE